jgi:predicted HTH domain antitoxin
MQAMNIYVSEDILNAANMNTAEMAAEMSRDYAVKLFEQGKLTLAQSARFCGMNIYDFLSALDKAGIPVINYDPEDLKKELAHFNQQ